MVAERSGSRNIAKLYKLAKDPLLRRSRPTGAQEEEKICTEGRANSLCFLL